MYLSRYYESRRELEAALVRGRGRGWESRVTELGPGNGYLAEFTRSEQGVVPPHRFPALARLFGMRR